MRQAKCYLKSVSPYQQGKAFVSKRRDGELAEDFEERTCRERMHVSQDGYVFIPPMQFCNCVKDAAKYLSIKIPGQRNATFTKHFNSGILVTDGFQLPIKSVDVDMVPVFVPADGKPGGGSRVTRFFPTIQAWEGDVTYQILDDVITPDVFERVLKTAGNLIGIGVFRPANRGYYGRYVLEHMDWQEVEL